MKKMFFLLVVVLYAAMNVMSQEVHGIESKMVCTYDCNQNGSWDNWTSYGETKHPYFSYEFTNLNSIAVSVEAELYFKMSSGDFVLQSTKSFVLRSQESYIWKGGNEKGIDMYWGPDVHDYKHYYVKYKAYKLL